MNQIASRSSNNQVYSYQGTDSNSKGTNDHSGFRNHLIQQRVKPTGSTRPKCDRR